MLIKINVKRNKLHTGYHDKNKTLKVRITLKKFSQSGTQPKIFGCYCEDCYAKLTCIMVL